MDERTLPFFTRAFLAMGVFFRTISDAEFAAAVFRLRKGEAPPPRRFSTAHPDAALQLLGLFQQEGRLVDFLEEDVTAFSDAEVGAAARVIHEGCRKVVRNYFTIVPIRKEPEGSRVVLEEGFDSSSVRLTGNVAGKPPFGGNLIHRGWRVSEIKLPKVAEGHDTGVLAAAEVEL